MLMPLPKEMLKEMDFSEVAIYLIHRGRPVLYKNKGVPLSFDTISDIYDRLDNFYILRSDAKFVVEEIGKKLREAFSKPADLSNMEVVFEQLSHLVDMVLASPTKEQMDFVKGMYYMFADYMESEPQAAYLVAFTIKKDFTTTLHVTNVSVLVAGFAYHLGYRGDRYKDICVSAFFHDIGKVKVPDDILKKPGKLTMREFEIIKRHTVWGAKILKENGFDKHVPVAMYHHEYLDGSGYPEGLTGSRIPEDARLVQICDIYEALTGIRPYRDPLAPYDALSLLRDNFVLKGKVGKDLYSEFLVFLYRNRYD